MCAKLKQCFIHFIVWLWVLTFSSIQWEQLKGSDLSYIATSSCSCQVECFSQRGGSLGRWQMSASKDICKIVTTALHINECAIKESTLCKFYAIKYIENAYYSWPRSMQGQKVQLLNCIRCRMTHIREVFLMCFLRVWLDVITHQSLQECLSCRQRCMEWLLL